MVTNKQIAGAVVAAVVVAAVIVVAVYTLRIRGSGRIVSVGLEAYSDSGAALPVSSVEWGDISPGGSSSATLYFKSISSNPVSLSLAIEGWNPATAADYMTVTWDYNGVQLQPGEVREVKFNLLVSGEISGVSGFSFDLVITASQN